VNDNLNRLFLQNLGNRREGEGIYTREWPHLVGRNLEILGIDKYRLRYLLNI